MLHSQMKWLSGFCSTSIGVSLLVFLLSFSLQQSFNHVKILLSRRKVLVSAVEKLETVTAVCQRKPKGKIIDSPLKFHNSPFFWGVGWGRD